MNDIRCQNSGNFPLFSDTSCVSRELYTGLLLASIIFGGLTFLLFVLLLFYLAYRRSIRSKPDYDTSSISDLDDPETNNLQASPSHPHPQKEISNVLRKIIGTTPHNGSPQTHLHHSFPMPPLQDSLLSSSNSFGELYSVPDRPNHKLLQSMNIGETISESFELPTRQTSNRTSMDNSNSAFSYDYQRKDSTKL